MKTHLLAVKSISVQHRPLAYRDFTVKAVLRDQQNIERILAKENALFVGTDHQTDTYFKIDKGKLKWRKGNIENLITHYERINDSDGEQTLVYRYDLNPSTADIENLFSTQEVIGTIQKTRKIYFLKNVKIHLDKLSTGEAYIELEAMDKEGIKTAIELREECDSVMRLLGVKEKDKLKTGYL